MLVRTPRGTFEDQAEGQNSFTTAVAGSCKIEVRVEEVSRLTPIRKNNRGISGVERLRTPVAGILIVGLQHH
jgi:hypothetical protein